MGISGRWWNMPISRRTFGALLIGVPVVGIPALGLLPPNPREGCHDFRHVPLSQIRCYVPDQFYDDELIRLLAQSIKEKGLLSYLTVALSESGYYSVINGGHRYHALRLIDYKKLVPVNVIPWSSIQTYMDYSSDIRSIKCNVEHS
jgi:hypothetical protein